ncbi:hypothetical protein DSO57_1024796 [Entomophthora muscae]|nr:hypothetical protein DSO57_1024796 [Entomophthora muscae]
MPPPSPPMPDVDLESPAATTTFPQQPQGPRQDPQGTLSSQKTETSIYLDAAEREVDRLMHQLHNN